MFGYQVDPPQGSHDEPGESSSNGAVPGAVPVPATEVNGVAAAGSSGGQRTTDAEVNGSTSDRGPRAVTVEEAEDDEDER